MLGIGFNTTISTGNLRNVGLLLYNTLDEKSKNSIKKLIIFTCLTFSFPVGAISGTIASIFCCKIIRLYGFVVLYYWHNQFG